MNKERKKHLGIYLGSLIAVEIFLLTMVLWFSIYIDASNAWKLFGWLQFCVPIAALWPFLIIEGLMYAEAKQQAQAEWDKKVEEIVKCVEQKQKEKEHE